MKNKFLIPILFVSALLVSCKEENQQNNKNLKYPKTTKKPVIDSLFGTAVTDNYRWLEDDRSKETEAWVQVEKVGTPHKEGESLFLERLRSNWHKAFNSIGGFVSSKVAEVYSLEFALIKIDVCIAPS